MNPADRDALGWPMTRERPILFSAPMVRAILAGSKSQTRRIVRRPKAVEEPRFDDIMSLASSRGWHGAQQRGPEDGILWRSGYCVPGDRLWVKECARIEYRGDLPMIDYAADTGAPILRPVPADHDAEQLARWAASNGWERVDGAMRCTTPTRWKRWRPSLHMPRWAARLTLDVVGVRVARLQALTAEDAVAEGVEDITAYGVLWDSLNADRAPWASNPWVFVVTFERRMT